MPCESIDTRDYDIGGGLEQVDGLPTRTYRPSWATHYQYTDVFGARPSHFRFYVAPGENTVR